MPKKSAKVVVEGGIEQAEVPTEVHEDALAVEQYTPFATVSMPIGVSKMLLDRRQVLLEVHRATSLLQAGATSVVVENLGGGDVYVSPNPYVYKPEFIVAWGERKEFMGEAMYAYAASRPTIQVTTFA